jgi:hypothetical protein
MHHRHNLIWTDLHMRFFSFSAYLHLIPQTVGIISSVSGGWFLCTSMASHSRRSHWPRDLRRRPWWLGRWDRGFESRLRHGYLSSSLCVVLSCVETIATAWSLVKRSPTECIYRLRHLCDAAKVLSRTVDQQRRRRRHHIATVKSKLCSFFWVQSEYYITFKTVYKSTWFVSRVRSVYSPQITSWSPRGMRVLWQCLVPRTEVA